MCSPFYSICSQRPLILVACLPVVGSEHDTAVGFQNTGGMINRLPLQPDYYVFGVLLNRVRASLKTAFGRVSDVGIGV